MYLNLLIERYLVESSDVRYLTAYSDWTW
jgi:hypothetical protein